MSINTAQTISELVANNVHTAPVFEKFGLDFCCKGNRTVETACKEAGVSVVQLVAALEQTPAQGSSPDFRSWPLDLLSDYIEKKHHRYVAAQIPILQQYLDKLVRVHGNKHPELLEIKNLFDGCAGELTMHMKKEELVLFPFVRRLLRARDSGELSISSPFGSVANPVAMMMQEHDTEGDRFHRIAALSNQYTPPSNACNTYKVCYAMLKEFEEDLHLHIHLENAVLFPGAIELEKSLAATA